VPENQHEARCYASLLNNLAAIQAQQLCEGGTTAAAVIQYASEHAARVVTVEAWDAANKAAAKMGRRGQPRPALPHTGALPAVFFHPCPPATSVQRVLDALLTCPGAAEQQEALWVHADARAAWQRRKRSPSLDAAALASDAFCTSPAALALQLVRAEGAPLEVTGLCCKPASRQATSAVSPRKDTSGPRKLAASRAVTGAAPAKGTSAATAAGTVVIPGEALQRYKHSHALAVAAGGAPPEVLATHRAAAAALAAASTVAVLHASDTAQLAAAEAAAAVIASTMTFGGSGSSVAAAAVPPFPSLPLSTLPAGWAEAASVDSSSAEAASKHLHWSLLALSPTPAHDKSRPQTVDYTPTSGPSPAAADPSRLASATAASQNWLSHCTEEAVPRASLSAAFAAAASESRPPYSAAAEECTRPAAGRGWAGQESQSPEDGGGLAAVNESAIEEDSDADNATVQELPPSPRAAAVPPTWEEAVLTPLLGADSGDAAEEEEMFAQGALPLLPIPIRELVLTATVSRVSTPRGGGTPYVVETPPECLAAAAAGGASSCEGGDAQTLRAVDLGLMPRALARGSPPPCGSSQRLAWAALPDRWHSLNLQLSATGGTDTPGAQTRDSALLPSAPAHTGQAAAGAASARLRPAPTAPSGPGCVPRQPPNVRFRLPALVALASGWPASMLQLGRGLQPPVAFYASVGAAPRHAAVMHAAGTFREDGSSSAQRGQTASKVSAMSCAGAMHAITASHSVLEALTCRETSLVHSVLAAVAQPIARWLQARGSETEAYPLPPPVESRAAAELAAATAMFYASDVRGTGRGGSSGGFQGHGFFRRGLSHGELAHDAEQLPTLYNAVVPTPVIRLLCDASRPLAQAPALEAKGSGGCALLEQVAVPLSRNLSIGSYVQLTMLAQSLLHGTHVPPAALLPRAVPLQVGGSAAAVAVGGHQPFIIAVGDEPQPAPAPAKAGLPGLLPGWCIEEAHQAPELASNQAQVAVALLGSGAFSGDQLDAVQRGLRWWSQQRFQSEVLAQAVPALLPAGEEDGGGEETAGAKGPGRLALFCSPLPSSPPRVAAAGESDGQPWLRGSGLLPPQDSRTSLASTPPRGSLGLAASLAAARMPPPRTAAVAPRAIASALQRTPEPASSASILSAPGMRAARTLMRELYTAAAAKTAAAAATLIEEGSKDADTSGGAARARRIAAACLTSPARLCAAAEAVRNNNSSADDSTSDWEDAQPSSAAMQARSSSSALTARAASAASEGSGTGSGLCSPSKPASPEWPAPAERARAGARSLLQRAAGLSISPVRGACTPSSPPSFLDGLLLPDPLVVDPTAAGLQDQPYCVDPLAVGGQHEVALSFSHAQLFDQQHQAWRQGPGFAPQRPAAELRHPRGGERHPLALGPGLAQQWATPPPMTMTAMGGGSYFPHQPQLQQTLRPVLSAHQSIRERATAMMATAARGPPHSSTVHSPSDTPQAARGYWRPRL